MKRLICSIGIFVLLTLAFSACTIRRSDSGNAQPTKTSEAQEAGNAMSDLATPEPEITDTIEEPTEELPTNTVKPVKKTATATRPIKVISPTADPKLVAFNKLIGTWKVIKISKSDRGVSWQEIGNFLTFQTDGMMTMDTVDGKSESIKFRIEGKQVLFTFADGKKERWTYTFTQSDSGLTLSKLGASERMDMVRRNNLTK
jgi:hypothetical protein